MYKIRVIFKTVVMGNMMCTRGPKPDIDEQQDTLTTQNFGARAGDKRNTLNGNYALKVGIDGNAQVRDTLKADIAGKQNIMQRNNNGTGADDTLNIIPVNGKGTVKTYEDGKLELRDTSVEGILQVEPKSKLIFQGPFSEEVIAYICLKNTSASESACFKVKTTKPLEYLVRPNKGIIHAQKTESIQVKLLPRAHDPNKMYKAKIGIESLAISRQDTDASSIESLWKNVIQDQIAWVTLRCCFEEPTVPTQIKTETLKALVSDRKYLEGNSNKLFDSQFCEPCKTEEKTAKATHFCENCNTFICESCKNCHSKFEVLRLHTFVPVNKSSVCLMNEKTVLQYLFNCNHCHREENFVETYCENHKEFMCMMCADLKHKDCDCSSINQDFLFNNAHMDEMLLKAQSVKEEI